MGMDVYGKKPTSETGTYFRNNVWYWHPLWDYICSDYVPFISEKLAKQGHYNSGAGLNAKEAKALGREMMRHLANGWTADYERQYRHAQAGVELEPCKCCDATGIRSDKVGQEMGMPGKELEQHVAIVVGRTTGWCNSCGGIGKVEPFSLNYDFTVDNVREFAEFLLDCGGFEIH